VSIFSFQYLSKTEFANHFLLKSPKIGKLNIDTLIIPQGLLIHEKTQTKKSHASVPLTHAVALGVVGSGDPPLQQVTSVAK